MTNTETPAITFDQMVELMLRNARFRAEALQVEMTTQVRQGGYSYMVRHLAGTAVKVEYRLEVLRAAEAHGSEGLVKHLARGLNESTSYTSALSNGVGGAIQEEARSLLREFAEFLDEAEMRFLLTRLF